jgi:hypothetical protein
MIYGTLKRYSYCSEIGTQHIGNGYGHWRRIEGLEAEMILFWVCNVCVLCTKCFLDLGGHYFSFSFLNPFFCFLFQCFSLKVRVCVYASSSSSSSSRLPALVSGQSVSCSFAPASVISD